MEAALVARNLSGTTKLVDTNEQKHNSKVMLIVGNRRGLGCLRGDPAPHCDDTQASSSTPYRGIENHAF